MCFTAVNYGTFRSLIGTHLSLFSNNSHPHVGGWISGPQMVAPIVEGTAIEFIGESGDIPDTFDIFFRPKVRHDYY